MDADAKQILKDKNNLISSFASRKQLKEAQDVFLSIKDVANSHSYSAILNAYIRCGDINGASIIFEDLTSKKTKVRPDVIIFTTMIKGFCSIFDFVSAIELFEKMLEYKPKVFPNIRTINTLLRGCFFVGNLKEATQLMSKGKDYEISFDSSSYEMVIGLLCQGLQLDIVFPLIGRLKSTETIQTGSAIIYYYVARALCLKGQWKKMNKILSSSLEGLQNAVVLDSDPLPQPLSSSSSSSSRVAVGGKRAWSTVANDSRDESLRVFLNHKKEELRIDIQNLSAYCNQQQKCSIDAYLDHVCNSFKRVLLFPYKQLNKLPIATPDLMIYLADSMKHSYGLDIFLKETSKTFNITEHYSNLFNSIGRIQYESFFYHQNDNKNHFTSSISSTSSSIIPNNKKIKVEICSGSGEWICQQATKDSHSLWIALEIRHDRVYNIFMNSIIQNLQNLIIMRGDATQIIADYFPFQSVDNFMINMPEPPQQRGSQQTTEASHLLNLTFLLIMNQALKSDGYITIVTDNKWYGQLLVRNIAIDIQQNKLKMKSILPTETSQFDGIWEVFYHIDNVYLYCGQPGREFGYVDTNASSYFQRLKKVELNSESKYFIVLQNHTTTTNNNNTTKINNKTATTPTTTPTAVIKTHHNNNDANNKSKNKNGHNISSTTTMKKKNQK